MTEIYSCNATFNDTFFVEDLFNSTCDCSVTDWNTSCDGFDIDYTFWIDDFILCCNCDDFGFAGFDNNKGNSSNGPVDGWELISLSVSITITLILVISSWIVCRYKLVSLRSISDYSIPAHPSGDARQPLLDANSENQV